MVKGGIDDFGHLQEPLLPDRPGTASYHSARQHILDLDTGNGDILFSGVSEKTLESQPSSYFGSRRWQYNPSKIGQEFAAAAVAKEDEKAKTRRSQSKRRLRNPIQKKSFVRRAAHTAANEPAYFLKNLIYGVVLWPKWAWDAMQSQKGLTVLSLKAGGAAGVASIISVLDLPAPYVELSSIAIWAVVTIDLLSEANIGLSLSKGVNRLAGTFSAGALAVILTQLGPDVPDSVYPYYVVFWVAFGGFVFRFLKGIPPLKDQWGYAFTVATITFHVLLVISYQQPERVTLPLLRFFMILLGFFLWSAVNLAFKPVFAGDTLHKLVAKNFDTAADILSRCVTEYTNSRMLDHVPDILSGRSEDDKIHQSYHEIVMSDSDVDKLLGAVTWEPCHGPFFNGYPWHHYDDITDYLRYTLYDVIALDSCLRASIQAPKFLRDIFAQEMKVIAVECSIVLHTLADSLRNMRKFSPEDILCQAEEAALALQNKIYIHTHLLLGRGAMDSPRYPLYVASSHGDVDPSSVAGDGVTGNVDEGVDYFKSAQNDMPFLNASEQSGQSYGSERNSNKSNRKNIRFNDGGKDSDDTNLSQSSPLSIPQEGFDQLGNRFARSFVQSNGSYGNKEIEQAGHSFTGLSDSLSESLSGHQRNQSMDMNYDGLHSLSDHTLHVETVATVLERGDGNTSVLGKTSAASATGWKENFMQRRSSLGHNWEGTLERISALSLVKFASLLIEVVAKMKFVVSSVDELSQAARFQEIIADADLVSGRYPAADSAR